MCQKEVACFALNYYDFHEEIAKIAKSAKIIF